MQSLEDYKKKTRLAIREEKLYHRVTNDEICWKKDGNLGFDLCNTGCCVICFESNPLVLEEHHIGGRNNAKATVIVCSNHHRILSTKQTSWPKQWTNKHNHDDLKFLFLFLGLIQLVDLLEYRLSSISSIAFLAVAYRIHTSEDKAANALWIILLAFVIIILILFLDDLS